MKDSLQKKYICIHGHFYQPPRENAWLDEIEIQESAAPYHDWNDRITDECYAPNCVSRILGPQERIVNIMSNFTRISFNFGPTLLSWMERHQPRVYQRILEADKRSISRFGGHGSAIAQVYNHIIMPLALRRDKDTQVKWGIYDFKKRFNRAPEGMWLAETAVDTETLEVLVENNIRFTVLSPYQAKAFRVIGTEKWTNGINSRQAYICNLPSGKSIYLFFYDGELSQKVAFGGLLNSGQRFVQELMNTFHAEESGPRLVHIATDGETFGHHHRHGDMALAFCLDHIEKLQLATITNYAEFLDLVPVTHEVQIVENSSWSCVHGVERWRSDCGCQAGGEPHWNQKWREGLRKALDELNQKLAIIFVDELSTYGIDPWHVRNEYIHLFANRSKDNTRAFVKKHFDTVSNQAELTKIIRLLEMQRQTMLMFTSCGWFFNEISGIETIQILQYAARAIQLSELCGFKDIESEFIMNLSTAKSNLPEYSDASLIYLQHVIPKKLSLTQIGMHFAVHSLFNETEQLKVLNYDCDQQDIKRYKSGSYILSCGSIQVVSRITYNSEQFRFLLIYLGNHHLIGNTATDMSAASLETVRTQAVKSFLEGNLAALLEIMRFNFFNKSFSFHDLFRDEQLSLLSTAIDQNLDTIVQDYEAINGRIYPMMSMMKDFKLQVPLYFQKHMSALISIKLEKLLKNENPLSLIILREQVREVLQWQLTIDTERLNYLSTKRLNRLSYKLEKAETHKIDEQALYITELLLLLEQLNIKPHLHELQNVVFYLLKFENQILMEFSPIPEEKSALVLLADQINIQVDLVHRK
ncbi:MAG: DUF3536 domain-containing protein [Saprospiraceae bacterium]|nr:DUF3536 domain-containing protein [Saprospiraceae bacterium]